MDAKLVVVTPEDQAGEYTLKLPAIVGRGREATLKLLHPQVSRKHCEIVQSGQNLIVRDLGSLNGTYVRGERINNDVALPPGELLTIGSVTFKAIYEGSDEQAEGAADHNLGLLGAAGAADLADTTADDALLDWAGDDTVQVSDFAPAPEPASEEPANEEPANEEPANEEPTGEEQASASVEDDVDMWLSDDNASGGTANAAEKDADEAFEFAAESEGPDPLAAAQSPQKDSVPSREPSPAAMPHAGPTPPDDDDIAAMLLDDPLTLEDSPGEDLKLDGADDDIELESPQSAADDDLKLEPADDEAAGPTFSFLDEQSSGKTKADDDDLDSFFKNMK